MKSNYFKKRTKRILFTGIILLVCSLNSFSQIEKGIIVNFGLASIESNNLNKCMLAKKKDTPYLITSDAHGNLGGGVGFGGSIKFPITEKLTLQSELIFNYQSSKLFINSIWDSLDVNKSGIRNRISSQASLKIFSLNVPMLLRFKLFDNKPYYFLSGFTLNVNAHPVLKSNEEQVYNEYRNGIVFSTDVLKANQKITMKRFNPTNVMLTLGLEKKLKRRMKNMSISFRCNFSLTKSPLYTNNSSFYDAALNNKILSFQGKSETESRAGFLMNDFKMTSYMLTITYNFKKKQS